MRGSDDRIRPLVVGGGALGVRRVRISGLCALALMLLAALTFGATRARATIAVNTLFSGGQGSAAWSSAADAPSDADGSSLQLTVPNGSSYAGVELQNESSTPATTPPSFWVQSSVSGPAQSAPRLVIAFSDGGYIDLHPANWTAGTWTKVDGATASWDDPGSGHCPVRLSVSYQEALSCHVANGAGVSELFLVSDATVPGGYVNYIDDISYGCETITSSGQASFTVPCLGGATTPVVTQFAATARIALSRGTGTFTTACQVDAGNHCHFKLTITAVVKSGGKKKTVKIGTVTGTMGGNAPSKLHITLNARGRSLLLAHQGGLPVTVSGSVADDGGLLGTHITKNMTLSTS